MPPLLPRLLRLKHEQGRAAGLDAGATEASHALQAHHHDAIRDLKAQLRMLSDELEQKGVANEELVAQDAAQRQQINALNSKLRQYTVAADDARALRDELDVWKSKAEHNERNQQELRRYREKLEDYEYACRLVLCTPTTGHT